MTGGWYCSGCGALYKTLGYGAIHCQVCGKLGLRGFDRKPQRVTCPVDTCDFTGWDDGGVNDDLPAHLRREHSDRIEAIQSRPLGALSRSTDTVTATERDQTEEDERL